MDLIVQSGDTILYETTLKKAFKHNNISEKTDLRIRKIENEVIQVIVEPKNFYVTFKKKGEVLETLHLQDLLKKEKLDIDIDGPDNNRPVIIKNIFKIHGGLETSGI